MKLSAIIISKNEEQMIADCLRSVSFADEILVFDSGSSDKTRTIARDMNARVKTRVFDNYAAQRTAALKHVTGDWVLYIDADERVSPELRDEILDLMHHSPSDSAYKIPRKNFYLGNHEWPKQEFLERLFKKENLKKWEGQVHEHAIYKGTVGTLAHPLYHYTHRDLSSMLAKTLMWADIESDMIIEAQHPPLNPIRFMRILCTKFYDSYIAKQGFKAGTVGLIESIYQAYSYFIIYAHVWEKQQKK